MRTKLTPAERAHLVPFIQAASQSLRSALFDNEAHGIVIILSGILRNAVGPIDNALWNAAKHEAAQPCGKHDCYCHQQAADLFEVLDRMRADWQEQNTDLQRRRKDDRHD